MSVFDYVNAINHSKEDIYDERGGYEYDPFIINKSLSYFIDTVLFANEMNINASIPKKSQFDFLRLGISKRKRFSKWHKQEKHSELVNAIASIENISAQRVQEMLKILSDSDKKKLEKIYLMKEK